MNRIEAALRDVEWGIFILSSLLVIFTARIDVLISILFHWDHLSAIWVREVFIFWAFLLLFLSLASKNPPGLLSLWPLLVLPAVATLSLNWTITPNGTTEEIFFFSSMSAFAYGAASLPEQRRQSLLKVFFFTAVVVSLYGIYQYLFGFAHTIEYLKSIGPFGAAYLVKALKPENQRAFSTLFSANVLACYISMAFPAGLAFAISEKGLKKIPYALCLAPLLVALAFTKSFGGGVGFVAGTGAFLAAFAFTRGVTLGKKAAGVLIAAIIIAGVVFLFITFARASGDYGFSQSFYQRTGYWKAAAQIIMKKPITGWGSGSFQILYPAHIHPGMDETRYVHDLPLQTLAETGVIGFLGLLLVVVALYSFCKNGLRKGSIISAAAIGGGTAYLVQNLVDFTSYVPETAAMFWLLFGLALGVNSKKSAGFILRIFLAAAGAVFIFFFVKSYIAEQAQEDALLALRGACIYNGEEARSTVPPVDAVLSAEKSVRIKPYDDSYHAFLADMYEGQAVTEPKMLDLALKEYNEAIRLNPYYPFHYRDLGILYMKMGRKTDAISAMKKAVERYPASVSLNKILKKAEGLK